MKISWSNLRMNLLILLSLATVLLYQNCAKPVSEMSSSSLAASNSPNSGGLSQQDIANSKAMSVLVSKCSSCHSDTMKSAGVNVLDTNEMLANGLIVPGEPSLSLIFTVIQSGQMPPSKPLDQADVQAVFDWVTNNFTSGTVAVTPTPAPTDSVTASYASINKNIIVPKCLGCHNSNNSAGGLSFSSYNATMNAVQKGFPANSSLYTSTAIKRSMPRNGAALSSSETKAISDWITAGALNN